MAIGKKNDAQEVPKIPSSAELLKLAQEKAEKDKALKKEVKK